MFTFTFNLHLNPTLSGVGFANRAEPTRTRSAKMMQTKRNALVIQDAGIIAKRKRGQTTDTADTKNQMN